MPRGKRRAERTEGVARTVCVKSRGTRVMRFERRGLENIDCADSGSHFCWPLASGEGGGEGDAIYVNIKFCPFSNIPV